MILGKSQSITCFLQYEMIALSPFQQNYDVCGLGDIFCFIENQAGPYFCLSPAGPRSSISLCGVAGHLREAGLCLPWGSLCRRWQHVLRGTCSLTCCAPGLRGSQHLAWEQPPRPSFSDPCVPSSIMKRFPQCGRNRTSHYSDFIYL